MLPENCRESQCWESLVWLLRTRRGFWVHPVQQPHPSPSSHSEQTPVAASSSCMAQALAATGFKCWPLCEQLMQLYNKPAAVTNNFVGEGCSGSPQAAHGLQWVGLQWGKPCCQKAPCLPALALLYRTETCPKERKWEDGAGGGPQVREWAGSWEGEASACLRQEGGSQAPAGARLEPDAIMVVGGTLALLVSELKVISENFICATVFRLGREKVRKC